MATKYKIGDRVRLGKHTFHPLEGRNWNANMDQYVGKIATLRRIHTNSDDDTIRSWITDIGIYYAWREINFTPVYFDEKQICSECKKPCPHIEANQKDNTYICVSCIFLRDLKL